jgi:hypothetical protein
MRKLLFPLIILISCLQSYGQETITKYLSGTDKDHTVLWDFYCTGGRKSGEWTKIPVPSNWELQGFGTYNYGHDKVKSNEQGLYKYEFNAGNTKGKKVFLVFEGSMTDTKVMVNGKSAGALHQGSFYRFKYDITDLLNKSGKNLLEVTVDKTSANQSVNNAERKSDFWLFGGIFRPVYLELVPERFIDRMAIDSKADGSIAIDVYPANLKGTEVIEAEVQTLKGKRLGASFFKKADKEDHLTLTSTLTRPSLWSAEFPNLYQVLVTLKDGKGALHKVKQKFGFRTVELRKNDGLYVNGAKIILKGSNRHSFWPETGRTLSHNVHTLDANLMKEMNMNAVRMSHYPPDQNFLDVCDSIGLYVLDELTGWQAKYDTEVGKKLVKELVVRDVNHPSILFWDNGNEGGWNTELDNEYKLYDPQNRTVIHPFETFNGTDTKHYPDFNAIKRISSNGKEVFFPTEFMHGLYDGGAGAALDDYWSEMLKHPHAAGGFIWAFVDEAVIRTDKNNTYDSDGNHGADGIVGPHREKEASFFTIKEIWSPVYIAPLLMDNFKGTIPLENRYSFTNLNQCTFKWKLIKFPEAGNKSTQAVTKFGADLKSLDLKPGEKGNLQLSLPTDWKENDALYLTAYGADKKEIFTWSWQINEKLVRPISIDIAKQSKVIVKDTEGTFELNCDGIVYSFNKSTGLLQKVVAPSGTVSLSNGPTLAGVKTTLKNWNAKQINDQWVIDTEYEGEGSLNAKWTFAAGQPVKLEYSYSQTGDFDYTGITFDYPEEKLTGIKWLGRGPYRVWQNRLKGQQFGVWEKAYNNTTTGETWGFPEFKGYHAEVNWVSIQNKESNFTVYTGDKNTFFQMLKPAREKDAFSNNYVQPAFPEGSIGFMNHISAIGNKFQSAKQMGPQSQKTHLTGEKINGTLWFDFTK